MQQWYQSIHGSIQWGNRQSNGWKGRRDQITHWKNDQLIKTISGRVEIDNESKDRKNQRGWRNVVID